MGRQIPRFHMAPAGGNPGCMHSIFNVLHHHHWSHVKRMLPYKRLGASSRHSPDFGYPGSDKSATNISQVQEHINADTSKFLIGEKATEHITRKSEADYCLLPKSSMKSRIKALMTEDRSKRKGRHRRSSSCPTHTQQEKTNTSPHSESTEFKGTNTKRSSSDAMMSDPIQPKHIEEPLTKTKTCELCAAIDRPSHWKHKDDNVKELSESASLQASQLMDALDIFGTRKEFFLKILQDPGSPLVHYLRNRQAIFNSKTGLKKSVSFPVAGSASRKAYESSSYICNQGPAPHAHGDDTIFQVCNHNFPYDANKFKSIPTLGRPKSFNNLPPCTPRGLKTEHENKPVVKRFKKLRQKISHVITESRNEKQKEIIRDPVFHKIPYDRNYSKIMMEDTDDLHESVVEKCSKYCPTNSSGNDHSTSVCIKQIDDDNQCYRRTSSYSESFHRYCRFFESSFYNYAKHQFSARLKLRAEEETRPFDSSKKSLGRLLSLPDLRSYFTLSIEEPPCPSGIQGKTFVGLSSTVSARLEEQKIPAVSVDQESQKLLDSQTESGAPKNILEYTKTPIDSDNVAARANSYDQCEFEPTESSENLESCSYNVVNSNSKEDTNCSNKISITEDSLASQHGKDIDSLHVADNTCVSDQRLEIPTKQSYGDFLRNCAHTKNIAEFNYVKDILELSGFSGNEVLGTWHSIGQPLDPLMFEEVESGICEHDKQVQNCKRLMFDLINEVLLDTHERSFAYFPMPLTCCSRISPMPVGVHVLEEVWENISWYLSWRSDSYQSLDDVVGRDLDKGDGWMNLQFDAECVGVELEDMIFEDLVDEMIFDDLLEELFWT